jgi:hypothetical protein
MQALLWESLLWVPALDWAIKGVGRAERSPD